MRNQGKIHECQSGDAKGLLALLTEQWVRGYGQKHGWKQGSHTGKSVYNMDNDSYMAV